MTLQSIQDIQDSVWFSLCMRQALACAQSCATHCGRCGESSVAGNGAAHWSQCSRITTAKLISPSGAEFARHLDVETWGVTPVLVRKILEDLGRSWVSFWTMGYNTRACTSYPATFSIYTYIYIDTDGIHYMRRMLRSDRPWWLTDVTTDVTCIISWCRGAGAGASTGRGFGLVACATVSFADKTWCLTQTP